MASRGETRRRCSRARASSRYDLAFISAVSRRDLGGISQAEIVVISSLSNDYCHIVTPPEIWEARALFLCLLLLVSRTALVATAMWAAVARAVRTRVRPAVQVPLRTRIYLGHYHEFHYVSTRPINLK